METTTTTLHSADTRRAVTQPQQFPALETITRPMVSTAAAAYYLNRQPQTLRGWACAQTFPEGLRPVLFQNRLCWPVAGIRSALGLTA